MDERNLFETPVTHALGRLEYLVALGVSLVLAVLHIGEIRWWAFIVLFVYIDLFGYIPGAIVAHNHPTGYIHKYFYVMYNIFHSLITAAVVAGLWCLFIGPEWALLALPIHLMGDRSLFGNTMKSFGYRFEPMEHPAYYVAKPLLRRPGRLTPGPAEIVPGERAGSSPRSSGLPAVGQADVGDACLEALRRYGTHSSGFLALNTGNSYFTEPGIDGVIPYRVSGRTWIQVGGPIAAPENRKQLLQAFIDAARASRRRILGVQLMRQDAELQQELGFNANLFGGSYSIDLKQFTLRGQKFVKTRNMITRARREGAEVVEVGAEGADTRFDTDDLNRQLDDLDAKWLRQKGWHTKEMRFLVGERSGPHQHLRRVFVAVHEGKVAAYVTYSPVFGAQPGWLYDLTRRRPDAPKGAIELVFATAAEQMRDVGDDWLHMGMTPFVELDDEAELPTRNTLVSKLIRTLHEKGDALYPAKTQLAFKMKWRPQVIEHEYIVFQGRPSLRATFGLMKAANIV